eukprot:scaffold17751_cov64-Attheya_sp.AAC.1
MTTLYVYSRPIHLRFEFDGYEEATFDPSSISNGCWDQRAIPAMDHSHIGDDIGGDRGMSMQVRVSEMVLVLGIGGEESMVVGLLLLALWSIVMVLGLASIVPGTLYQN